MGLSGETKVEKNKGRREMKERQRMRRIKGKVKNKKEFLPAFLKFLEESDEFEFEINAGIAEKVGEKKWIETVYDGHTTILIQTYHKNRDERHKLFKKSEELINADNNS